MTKYPRYQDYVIKDGKLVGEFEQMYQDFDDPWEQTTREQGAFEKQIALEIVRRQGYQRVMELGCGLGDFTAKLQQEAKSVLGVDVSKTAIQKAQKKHPGLSFAAADILDFDVYRKFKPDCIIMAEITWYVLEKLDQFKSFLSSEMRGTGIIHLLMTYREGEQKYGREYFTDLEGIMKYWGGVDFQDWGSFSRKEYHGGKRTFFHGVIV